VRARLWGKRFFTFFEKGPLWSAILPHRPNFGYFFVRSRPLGAVNAESLGKLQVVSAWQRRVAKPAVPSTISISVILYLRRAEPARAATSPAGVFFAGFFSERHWRVHARSHTHYAG